MKSVTLIDLALILVALWAVCYYNQSKALLSSLFQQEVALKPPSIAPVLGRAYTTAAKFAAGPTLLKQPHPMSDFSTGPRSFTRPLGANPNA